MQPHSIMHQLLANAGNAHKAGFSLKFLNHAPASTATCLPEAGADAAK